MPSPAGWREVPCARCGTFVAGIDFGERCVPCQRDRLRRANHRARRISLVATAGMAGWIFVSRAAAGLGPWYTVMAIAGTYGMVYVISKRIAMEVM